MQNKTVSIMATDDSFAIQEKDEPIWKSVGLDAQSIVDHVLRQENKKVADRQTEVL